MASYGDTFSSIAGGALSGGALGGGWGALAGGIGGLLGGRSSSRRRRKARRANRRLAREAARAQAEMLRLQEGMGARARTDIGQKWRGLASQGAQGMVSSGLSGTTVAPTMQGMYARGEGAEVGALEDRLRGQRLGLLQGFMPSTGQLGGMAQQAGQASASPNLLQQLLLNPSIWQMMGGNKQGSSSSTPSTSFMPMMGGAQAPPAAAQGAQNWTVGETAKKPANYWDRNWYGVPSDSFQF